MRSPSDEAEFRRFLHDLAGRFSVLAVSSLWVGEYELAEATNSPEFAVADAVIGLETKRSAERTIRHLSVRKLRGSDFLSGDHVYRITAGGLVVFPRLADLRDDTAFSAGRRTGVDGHRRARRVARGRLLVRFDHPHRRAVRRRQIADGPALRVRRRSTSGTRDLRDPAREPNATRPCRRSVRVDHRRSPRDRPGPIAGRSLRRRARLRHARPRPTTSAPADS